MVVVQTNDAGANAVVAFDRELAPRGRMPSGGARPLSVAARDDTAWVLNGGEEPSVGELSLRDGTLARTIPLAAREPAQVGIAPDGRTLVVTDKGADAIVL